MIRFATFLAFLLLASSASSQTSGSCSKGTAEGTVDISSVLARVFNTGSLFFGNTTTSGDGYLVPKASANSPLYAAAFWVGGKVDGGVRTAAGRYRNTTFWPGPLDSGASLPNPSDCSAFDRIYVVSRIDLNNYNSGAGASTDLAEWPVGLGAPAVDANGQPLVATSRSQIINLDAGERPALLGDETAFWVMNDVGGPRREVGSVPLGIEVRVSAFGVSSPDRGLDRATFYRYQIINQSGNTIEDMRVGFFADVDLGDASDDFIATDPDRGMMYAYNGRDVDDTYGINPPAIGFDILSGASSGGYFGGGGPGVAEPTTDEESYNFLNGTWGDGTPIRQNDTGYSQPETFPTTLWAYPADPVSRSFWSEENADGQGRRNSPGDRRGHVSVRVPSLASGASTTVDMGILFAQGTSRFDSITLLRGVSDRLQATYDSGDLFIDGRQIVVAREAPTAEASGVTLTLAPNPARGVATVRLTLTEASGVRVRVLDALGREVAIVAEGPQAAGEHTWALPADLASGVYAVEATADGERTSARWTVIR